MTMTDLSTFLLSETVVTSVGTFCWMSPELLDPPRFGSSGRPTRKSDSYAFGMLIYEVSGFRSRRRSHTYPPKVLTGLRPFYHFSAYTPVPAVLRGERPEKPREAESLGFSQALWGLVQSCWSESSSARPTAQQLFDYLSPASLTWVPPLEYPVGIGGGGINDSSSSGYSTMSTASSMHEA